MTKTIVQIPPILMRVGALQSYELDKTGLERNKAMHSNTQQCKVNKCKTMPRNAKQRNCILYLRDASWTGVFLCV